MSISAILGFLKEGVFRNHIERRKHFTVTFLGT
jgi:hypothetical protein